MVRTTVLLLGSVFLTAVLLLTAGCDDTSTGPPPWSSADSSHVVIENLEYAYNYMNLELYMECFRNDFVFIMPVYMWGDYNGDGIIDVGWGLEAEEQIHQNMFENSPVESISLDLTIPEGVPDSLGGGYIHYCDFQLFVYTDPWTGYRASGQARFFCRQDTTDGHWYIWKWVYESAEKENVAWATVKIGFSDGDPFNL